MHTAKKNSDNFIDEMDIQLAKIINPAAMPWCPEFIAISQTIVGIMKLFQISIRMLGLKPAL